MLTLLVERGELILNGNGGWVFISHSHQDIALVRKIRNQLENFGMEPLMFFLKCLSDDDEIEDLIKREIDEREWFIYADSPNARVSRWVETERQYIEKQQGKKVFTIDLGANLESQLRQIEHIVRQMKVFISYTHADRQLYQRLRDRILKRDMLVLSDENIRVGSDIGKTISENIEDASRNGFVIVLITEQSVQSNFVYKEIQKTISLSGKIIPVFVGNAVINENMLSYIGDIQGYTVPEYPTDEDFDALIENMLHRVEFYQSDFRNSCGYQSARIIHLPPISRIDNQTFWGCTMLECVYVPDTVIYITPDAFEGHPNILVKCRAGSYVEGYCRRCNIRYELIE